MGVAFRRTPFRWQAVQRMLFGTVLGAVHAAGPLIAGMLLAGFATGQTRNGSFVTGYNHPWAAYGHDFGENAWGHDGVITSGWTFQNFPDSEGFTDTRRVGVSNCGGRPALRITANLRGQTANRSSGEVELTISNHPPRRGPLPAPVQSLDLEGVTARVRLWLPPGSAGPPQARNGFQLFFKTRLSDTDFPTLRSEWLNIDPAWENTCVELPPVPFFRVSNAGPGERFGAFNAKSVAIIGFKVGINSSSAAQITGFIDMESFTLETSPRTVFDFEKLEFEKDYEGAATLTGANLNVARVFIFADGRAAPEFGPDGSVTGLDRYVEDDFRELLRIAERTNMRIMPVLLDFGWCGRVQNVSGARLGGHSDVIRELRKREDFVKSAVEPLLRSFGRSPWIHSWDVINEPEWVMQGVWNQPIEGFDPDKVTVAEMQEFVRLCADAIRRLAIQPVTVGSARRMWLRYWNTTGLGFYQFHWYDKFQAEEPFPFRPASELGLDKPVLVGEVPTAEAQFNPRGELVAGTRYKAGQFLEACRDGGYSGLLLWSFRAGDSESDFVRAAADLAARIPRFSSDGLRNAASFQSRLAPNSLASVFGERLAAAPLAAISLPLPTRLGPTSMTVTDSVGSQELVRLLFVSPTQMNFVMPERVRPGPATLTVDRADGFPSSTPMRLDGVAPGLFSANADGQGVAAAAAVRVAADGTQTPLAVYQCGPAPGSCVPVPIELGTETDRVYLALYGTGIRGRSSLAAVRVSIGGLTVPALYADAQPQFVGLDQVNVEMPRSLTGRGVVGVVVTADGVASNTVTIHVR